MHLRQLFDRHLAPTSASPAGLHVSRARGSYLYDDIQGKRFIDLIGGISVANIGHSHPSVLAAIREQSEAYLHVMVYGEVVQSPQVDYAALLCRHLPPSLDCVYFTNSGSEATEGALKLARRATGRPHVLACKNSYHGATMGALSLIGDEYWRSAFRPLLPGIWHYDYNSAELIDAINEQTACVVLETVQAEAGVVRPEAGWLLAVRERCTQTGTMLVLDEIQCGFGRTGTLWGFEQYGVVPDVVLLGKALGGGLPLGAFIAPHSTMQLLTHNPVLGHITTFGGHPLSCAAGMAALGVLAGERLIEGVAHRAEKFHSLLKHPRIKEVRGTGLLLAVELESSEAVMETLKKATERGLFSDWFLFAPHCIRIAPALNISEEEIEEACAILLPCLE